MDTGNLPYWLVNVVRKDWPKECPDYLININAKDKEILSTADADYSRLTWRETQEIISTGSSVLAPAQA